MLQKSERVFTLSTDIDVDAQYVLDDYNSDEDSITSKVGKNDLAQHGLSIASVALLEKYAFAILAYLKCYLKLTI